MANLSVEKKLIEVWAKSVAIDLHLWNGKTKKLNDDAHLHPAYQANLQTIKDYLADGWTAKDLEDKLWDMARLGYREPMLHKLLPAKAATKKITETDNLLVEGLTYQHAQLYDRRMPSYTVAVSAEGEMLVPVTRGTNTLKKSYTLKDLVNYYMRETNTPQTPNRVASATNYLRYLLNTSSVDEVLHAVDMLADGLTAPPSPTEVSGFLTAAEEEIRVKQGRANEGVDL